MNDFVERLRLLVRARYPLLFLLTYEEDRVERALRKDDAFPVWRWRSTEGLRGPQGLMPDTSSPSRALEELAKVEGPALFLMADFPMAQVSRALRDLEPILGGRGQGMLFCSPILAVPRDLEKDVQILDVPLPSQEEVGRLLAALLRQKGQAMDPTLQERFVKASLGLTEKEIKRAYARMNLERPGDFTEERLADLVEAKRQAIRRSRFLEFYDQELVMDDVGGLDNLKRWLEKRALAFGSEARAYGLPEPKGVFLIGVQGCGKSLTAKAVAGLFRVPLLRLDVAALFSGAGMVEESLRETIRIAESVSPAVLWIDELEKGFLSQHEGATAGSAFGTFLTWLQEKQKAVFVVATANEVRSLPPELMRKGRFDEVFFVDLPGVHDRLSILEIHLKRRGRNPATFELYQVAEESDKYSGAELEQVVVEAMFNAFSEGRELNERDLLKVVRDTVPLAVTMDDKLKDLREWARPRTRPAANDRRRIDFFEDFEEVG